MSTTVKLYQPYSNSIVHRAGYTANVCNM